MTQSNTGTNVALAHYVCRNYMLGSQKRSLVYHLTNGIEGYYFTASHKRRFWGFKVKSINRLFILRTVVLYLDRHACDFGKYSSCKKLSIWLRPASLGWKLPQLKFHWRGDPKILTNNICGGTISFRQSYNSAWIKCKIIIRLGTKVLYKHTSIEIYRPVHGREITNCFTENISREVYDSFYIQSPLWLVFQEKNWG